MKEQEIIVMKFGGSSVRDAEGFNRTVNIVSDYSREYKVVVVVSAIYGVTDRLLDIVDGIKSGRDTEAKARIDDLYKLHYETAGYLDLLEQRPLSESLHRFRVDLQSFVQFRAIQPFDKDLIVSYGERLSHLLLQGAISRQGVTSEAVDAAKVIVTNTEYGDAKVDLELSQVQAKKYISPLIERSIIPVLGGFYGISYEGKIAILGRDGSDYSAAVVANNLDAGKLILWKEVNGVYSSDPKKDSSAEFLPNGSYDQVKALVQNGQRFIHPEAIPLLEMKNILLYVKNFNNPSLLGSRIH